MARLQVLILPDPGDEYPFALIIDQCDEKIAHDTLTQLKVNTGARAVFLYPGTLDLL